MLEIKKTKLYCLLLSVIIFSIAENVSAQGTNPGRINPPKTPTTKKPTNPPPKTKSNPKPTVKLVKSKIAKTPKVKKSNKTQYGSLQISVNEPDSEVFLSGANGNALEENSIFVEDTDSPLEIDDLQTGSYTIRVRKTGYFEIEQKVFISANKKTSVSLSLKSSNAFLTITTNVDGVSIEIENVREFENRAENLQLAPGTYRINVYKNGYISQTKQAELNAAGQKITIDFELIPLPIEQLVDDAQASFNRQDYQTAIANCRQILSASPNHSKANLLAGASYFNSSQPTGGARLLSRAVAAGEQVTLPVRIFNKENSDLQLPLGNLTISRDLLQFGSSTHPALNFAIAQSDIIEFGEKVDEFGITYISINATGDFGGTNDKRTVRLYSEPTVVKSSREELACSNCSQTLCLCRSAEQSLFEVVSRWKTKDFTTGRAGFSAVMLPSADFVLYQVSDFSLKLPENWLTLIKENPQILAAPLGAFNQYHNPIRFSHGVNVVSLPNPDGLSTPPAALGTRPRIVTLNQMTENYLSFIIKNNPHLKPDTTVAINLRGKATLVNSFSGLSPISQREEVVTIYTMIIPSNNNLLAIITITPPDESAEYKDTFRRILNSINF